MVYTVWIVCFRTCVFLHADTYVSPLTPFQSLLVVINAKQMSFLLFLFLISMASLVIKTGIPLILILHVYAWGPVVKFKVVHLQHWSIKNMVTFHVANTHHLAKNHSSTDACMPFYRPLRLLMYKFYLHQHYFYHHNYHTIAGWSCILILWFQT